MPEGQPNEFDDHLGRRGADIAAERCSAHSWNGDCAPKKYRRIYCDKVLRLNLTITTTRTAVDPRLSVSDLGEWRTTKEGITTCGRLVFRFFIFARHPNGQDVRSVSVQYMGSLNGESQWHSRGRRRRMEATQGRATRGSEGVEKLGEGSLGLDMWKTRYRPSTRNVLFSETVHISLIVEVPPLFYMSSLGRAQPSNGEVEDHCTQTGEPPSRLARDLSKHNVRNAWCCEGGDLPCSSLARACPAIAKAKYTKAVTSSSCLA